jgi:ribosomal-protein-alanine N-acetyltransferase
VRLREYWRGDLRAIFELDEICFVPPFRFSLSSMRYFAEAKNALTVIAESGKEIAGFCIVHVSRVGRERVGYVVTLDVAPAMRGHGLATTMMQRMEEQSRKARCNAMALHVSVGNESAIRFYERAGYLQSEVARDFYGAGMDAFIYRKTLAEPPIA